MDVLEYANALSVSPRRVRALIARNQIPAHRNGGRWVIDVPAARQPLSSRPLSPASQQSLALALHRRSLAGLTGQDRARTAARIRALRASNDPAVLLASWWAGREPTGTNGGTNLVQHAVRGDKRYVRERIQARPTEYLREWAALAEVVSSERTIRGLSRPELANLAAVTPAEVNALERARPIESISSIRRILRALDVEPTAIPSIGQS